MNRQSDGAVEVLLDAVPDFVNRYLGLADAADGEPGAAAAFTELADYVADLLSQIDSIAPVVARCLAAVESVAHASDDRAELVAWAFLDSLSPDDRRLIEPWLGPCTRRLLEEVDAGYEHRD
jgi:hypothetical protein